MSNISGMITGAEGLDRAKPLSDEVPSTLCRIVLGNSVVECAGTVMVQHQLAQTTLALYTSISPE